MSIQDFTLKNAKGETVTYIIAPHDGEDAVDISMELMAMVSDQALEAALAALVDSQGVADSEKAFSVLSASLGKVLRQLKGDMRRTLFRHVTRNGKDLSDKHEFGLAYSQNYGEFYAALALIEKVNSFVPLDYFFSEGKGILLTLLPKEHHQMVEEFLSAEKSDGSD